MNSTSPRYGEKASYYSAVCLETGEVEWMELEGNSNSGTSAAFLDRLRQRHSGPLDVIWDNAPAHRGEAVREYLRAPGLELRLVNLPGYSPDFNADEAIWGWVREEATGNLCLGTKALVQERVGNFLHGLSRRKDEVKRRCRTILQSRAEGFLRESQPDDVSQMHIPPWLWFRKPKRRLRLRVRPAGGLVARTARSILHSNQPAIGREGGTAVAVGVKKYNPGFLTDDEIVASFCVRTGEFDALLECLRASTGQSNAHALVIGPRGSGKTHLLLRVATEMRRMVRWRASAPSRRRVTRSPPLGNSGWSAWAGWWSRLQTTSAPICASPTTT